MESYGGLDVIESLRAGCGGELPRAGCDEEPLRAGCDGEPLRAGCDRELGVMESH